MDKPKEQNPEQKEKVNLEDFLKVLDFSKIDIPLKKHFVSTEKWLRRGQVFVKEDVADMDIDRVELRFIEFFNKVKDLKIDSSSIQKQIKVDLTKIPQRSNQILKLYGKVLRKKIFKDNLWSYDMNLLFLWTVLKTASLSEKSVYEMSDADWDIVADAFFCSEREDLKFQWQYLQKSVAKKAPWTEEEDKILADLLKNGEPKNKKWKYVAKHLYELSTRKVPRLGRHCHERWTYHLDPNLKKKCPWTQEEDDIIVESVQKYGKRWSMISKKLSGRNENSVKIRFKRLQNIYAIKVPDSEKKQPPLVKPPYPGLKNENSQEYESEKIEQEEESANSAERSQNSESFRFDPELMDHAHNEAYLRAWNGLRYYNPYGKMGKNWDPAHHHLNFERLRPESCPANQYPIKLEEEKSGEKSKANAPLASGPLENLLYHQNYVNDGWGYKYPGLIMANVVQIPSSELLYLNVQDNNFPAPPVLGIPSPNLMRNNIYSRNPYAGLNAPFGMLPLGSRIIMPSSEEYRSKFLNEFQAKANPFSAEAYLSYGMNSGFF